MNGSTKVPMNGKMNESTDSMAIQSISSREPQYHVPTKGLLALLPQSWIPYAELIRLHKPVGILNVYFPYFYGSIFAAIVSDPIPSPLAIASVNARLLAMAFLLRCAGCTWNDILDRDLDRQVARCRLRPMARNAISPRSGYLFFAVQILIWAAMLVGADIEAWTYAIVAVLLAQIYPFAKRVTDYSQVVLGVTLSWGVLVGSVMQGVMPTGLTAEQPAMGTALACLYWIYVIWCIIHDTIYAFQDVKDDAKAGVKSMSLAYETTSTLLLSVLAVTQVGLQVAMGAIIGAGVLYSVAACVGVATLMCCMILSVDVKDPQQCWWWFQYGCLIVGSAIAVGLIGEYVQRYSAVQSI